MLLRFKFVLPFALAGVVSFAMNGSLFAQGGGGGGSGGGGSTGGGSSSAGSGSSASGSSPTFSLGNVGFGTTGTGSSSSSTSPFGNSPSSSNSANSSGVGSTSLLGPNMGNPLAAGLPTSGSGGTTTKSFGTALYNVSTSGTSGTSGSTGGRAGGRAGSTTTSSFGGARAGGGGTASVSSTYTPATSSYRSSPSFTTRVAFTAPAPLRAEVRESVQRAVIDATDLASRNGIEVSLDGDAVVLRGKVATSEEKRIVESLARLTPGVNVVRNELVPLRDTGD